LVPFVGYSNAFLFLLGSLHKAAQKKNTCIIRWLGFQTPHANGQPSFTNESVHFHEYDCAITKYGFGAKLTINEWTAIGLPDASGNKPSDILQSVGGDEKVVNWMRKCCKW